MSFRSALWRNRDFVRLWLAQGVSAFGARITREGLPIAAALGLGAQPAQVGLLAALANGPALIVGLAAGGLVDRTGRKRLMIGADLLRAVVLASIPLAAVFHRLGLPHLYAAAAVVGAASVLFEIADHAYLPGLVPQGELLDANASLSATESVAEIGGPALAGALFQALAPPLAIAANAATYLASALVLGRIRHAEATPEADPQTRWTEDVRIGFAVALGHPVVRPVFLTAWLQSLAGGTFSALYVLFCVRTVGLTPGLLGLTIATGGVGALAGALVAGRLSKMFGVGPSLVGAQAAVALAIALIPLSPPGAALGMPVLMVSQFFGDAFGTASLILGRSLSQSLLPAVALGRATATYRAVGGGLVVVGALAGGLLGEALGLRGALWVGVAGLALTPLVGLASQLPRSKTLPRAEDVG